MLEIVLKETFVAFPKSTAATVIPPRSLVMLLKVFPVIVFVEPPSLLFQATILVVPATVTFEKLFPAWIMLDPLADGVLELKNDTDPLSALFLQPVTIALLLQLSKPVGFIA